MTTEGTPRPPGAAATGHGPASRRRHWGRWATLGLALLLVGAAGAGWVAYERLDANITADEGAAAELARHERERPRALVPGARNVLLIGSDSRAGGGDQYGRDSGTERSDTTILLHVAAGRRGATAVSLPRDLMVHVPDCRMRDGSRSRPVFAMFNSAFATGGSACSVRTVEKLTGIRVDHFVVVDFNGFKTLVDALDGVPVCLKEPLDDKDAKVKLPAGKVTLDGEQALGYVRARKSLGDGSDTERMERQQRFLGALVAKVNSTNVLLNPLKLYPVLDAATSSLTTDPELASLRGLYGLLNELRNLPPRRVQFLTVPRRPYSYNADRDQLVEPAARELFERLRRDQPVKVTRDAPSGPPSKAGASPSNASAANTAPSNTAPPNVTLSNASPSNATPPNASPSKAGAAFGVRNSEQSYGDAESLVMRPGVRGSTPQPPPTFPGKTAAPDGCG
ncbi:LCP family protein [Streptomyces sp. RY43-2]|uniref:LCP family protein n=1 Tax=Streptomyces macrolidinus TaxID=2952607 RepID=A0ABT0ZKJ2_9ACTN|nr:LCP family protein [Streptomyces macrolidinus]MCN9244113.1 LCP family protein [Streptomyces macrolidinus]